MHARALLIFVATGCGVTPAPPLANTAPPRPPRVVDTAWKFEGSAHFEAGALRVSYCCVDWGSAARWYPIEPGAWDLALVHANTECTTGARAFVFDDDGIMLADAPLDAGRAGGLAVASFETDQDTHHMRIMIGEIGDYDCCGTTTIQSISLAPR